MLRVVWPAKDGYVRYRIYSGQFGQKENLRLARWLDDEGLADEYIRGIDWAALDWLKWTQEEIDRVHGYIGRLFANKTRAQLAEEARRRSIMLEPFSTPVDMYLHPQLQARDYWQPVDYPGLSVCLSYPGRSCLPSGTPCRHFRGAPAVGEHNAEVFQEELGISDGEFKRLKDSGVI
jgi:crotonobetainyl-CoA:carnitine CoA-transferase CaiB-like acyl-CoA transferase